jgi:hypothetical protein
MFLPLRLDEVLVIVHVVFAHHPPIKGLSDLEGFPYKFLQSFFLRL